MQIVASKTSGYNPVRSFLGHSYEKPMQKVLERYTNLLSAGIARAPAYERNWMLTSLFKPDAPDFASGQVAEAVVQWLCSGRVMPVPVSSLSRYSSAKSAARTGSTRPIRWPRCCATPGASSRS